MVKTMIEAPLEEYEKCGFSLKHNKDGSIDIRAINSESSELMIGCYLNVVVWGPKGNFVIDPDEDGLLVHIPVYGQSFTKPTESKNRKLINHGLWFIDILYGLDKSTTKVVDRELNETFDISNDKHGAVVIKRKFVHKLYQYKWPYVLHCYPDGHLKVTLRKPIILKRIFKV